MEVQKNAIYLRHFPAIFFVPYNSIPNVANGDGTATAPTQVGAVLRLCPLRLHSVLRVLQYVGLSYYRQILAQAFMEGKERVRRRLQVAGVTCVQRHVRMALAQQHRARKALAR